jgi:hypothetical protein
MPEFAGMTWDGLRVVWIRVPLIELCHVTQFNYNILLNILNLKVIHKPSPFQFLIETNFGCLHPGHGMISNIMLPAFLSPRE